MAGTRSASSSCTRSAKPRVAVARRTTARVVVHPASPATPSTQIPAKPAVRTAEPGSISMIARPCSPRKSGTAGSRRSRETPRRPHGGAATAMSTPSLRLARGGPEALGSGPRLTAHVGRPRYIVSWAWPLKDHERAAVIVRGRSSPGPRSAVVPTRPGLRQQCCGAGAAGCRARRAWCAAEPGLVPEGSGSVTLRRHGAGAPVAASPDGGSGEQAGAQPVQLWHHAVDDDRDRDGGQDERARHR